MSRGDIEVTHNRLQAVVTDLLYEEHDPFVVAGCMLAIAIQLYRVQEMKWDNIKKLLDDIHATSIKSEEHIKETIH